MKKTFCILLAVLMLFALAACGKKAPAEQPTPSPALAGPTPEPAAPSPTPAAPAPAPATEAPAETAAPAVSYTLYLPNANADGFDTLIVGAEEITAEAVLAELKGRNVLPQEAALNSFRVDGPVLYLDFNQAFAAAVCSMGTSGELMIMGSLVNTFLEAFHARSLYITVEGQILESGHMVYDYALTFFTA